jgi:hypothetical protein
MSGLQARPSGGHAPIDSDRIPEKDAPYMSEQQWKSTIAMVV